MLAFDLSIRVNKQKNNSGNKGALYRTKLPITGTNNPKKIKVMTIKVPK